MAFDIVSDPAVEEIRRQRAIAYGTWECGDEPIDFDGARAFNPGDAVPKDTVERLGLDGLGAVVPFGTRAKKLQAEEAAKAKAESARQSANAKGGK